MGRIIMYDYNAYRNQISILDNYAHVGKIVPKCYPRPPKKGTVVSKYIYSCRANFAI